MHQTKQFLKTYFSLIPVGTWTGDFGEVIPNETAGSGPCWTVALVWEVDETGLKEEMIFRTYSLIPLWEGIS